MEKVVRDVVYFLFVNNIVLFSTLLSMFILSFFFPALMDFGAFAAGSLLAVSGMMTVEFFIIWWKLGKGEVEDE
jgi:hypothetical protein